MTETEFDNGYWYVDELRVFAKELGIPSTSKLRKDELEKAIKDFLRTGKVKNPTKRNLKKTGEKDISKGLSLTLKVVHYTSNKQTKEFIVTEAKKIVPDLRERSGVRYRLNRWREEQITLGKEITYGDLVHKYIELNQSEEPFARVPHGRYINFVADFLANEKNATREEAIKHWENLKELDIPKTYTSWKKWNAKKS
ncbi:hypothetical protein UABAM_01108 [Candidatus Uabimicrobium amorphum]|uniref:Uncharacterized protein n=2 Tax=Uabimicrobium amorphum TaxID=2596890 RepID=A0A5S9ILH6_UABAM|nr:hypothetical protein UABAM_01108 [Candidatus Uabimicrobium amorphum]